MLKYLWITLSVIGLDQWTKKLAIKYLVVDQPYPIIPGFQLSLTYNRGAAFSFLNFPGYWQRWFLSSIAIAASVILIFWISRLNSKQKLLAIALASILGGAIGNLTDRLIFGSVIDFIDCFIPQWHFPTFNVADTFITLGAFLLFIVLWRKSSS